MICLLFTACLSVLRINQYLCIFTEGSQTVFKLHIVCLFHLGLYSCTDRLCFHRQDWWVCAVSITASLNKPLREFRVPHAVHKACTTALWVFRSWWTQRQAASTQSTCQSFNKRTNGSPPVGCKGKIVLIR